MHLGALRASGDLGLGHAFYEAKPEHQTGFVIQRRHRPFDLIGVINEQSRGVVLADSLTSRLTVLPDWSIQSKRHPVHSGIVCFSNRLDVDAGMVRVLFVSGGVLRDLLEQSVQDA